MRSDTKPLPSGGCSVAHPPSSVNPWVRPPSAHRRRRTPRPATCVSRGRGRARLALRGQRQRGSAGPPAPGPGRRPRRAARTTSSGSGPAGAAAPGSRNVQVTSALVPTTDHGTTRFGGGAQRVRAGRVRYGELADARLVAGAEHLTVPGQRRGAGHAVGAARCTGRGRCRTAASRAAQLALAVALHRQPAPALPNAGPSGRPVPARRRTGRAGRCGPTGGSRSPNDVAVLTLQEWRPRSRPGWRE